jgi:uncharacterized membrane protein
LYKFTHHPPDSGSSGDVLALNRFPGAFAPTPREKFILLIGLLVLAAGILILSFTLTHLNSTSTDFPQDYNSAQSLRLGQSIYSVQNDHPPFDALLFLPLTDLSLNTALIVWAWISILLYILTGWIVIRELKIRLAPAWVVFLLGAALIWFPFEGHIAVGQLSILLSFIIVAAWVLLRRNREIPAGVLLGLACLIKLFPGILLFYLVLRRHWRAAAAMLGIIAGGMAVSILALGPMDVLAYFTQVSVKDAAIFAPFPQNSSFYGVFSRLFINGLIVSPIIPDPPIARLLAVLISLGLLLQLALQTLKKGDKLAEDDRAYALTILAMLFVSPITWGHMLVILVLPYGILVSTLQQQPDAKLRTLSLLSVLLISLPDTQISYTLMALYYPNRIPWPVGLVFLIPTLSMLVVWVLLSQIHPVPVRNEQ